MLEALISTLTVAFGGVVVFLAILGVCRIVEDMHVPDDKLEEPRE